MHKKHLTSFPVEATGQTLARMIIWL